MNHLNFIMAYESGEPIDEEEVIAGFQAMIDSGVVWQLQGQYTRTAWSLIKSGYCYDNDR